MIDTKTYNNLILDLVKKTGCTKSELENMLCIAIAKVYGGVNSALIYEDGSVSIAFVKDGVIVVKDYIVSKKHFTQILSTMSSLLKEQVITVDMNNYLENVQENIYTVERMKLNKFEYKIELFEEHKRGFLRDYTFYISKNDLFLNDEKKIKNDDFENFFVTVFNLSKEKKRVLCGRFNKTIAKHIFNVEFEKVNKILSTNYSVVKVALDMNKKEKSVKYFIEFGNKPSGVFVSELSKRLKKNLGNVEIHFEK